MTPTQPPFAAAVEAAIAEVEAVARAATVGRWKLADVSLAGAGYGVHRGEHDTIALYATRPDAAHIAANDPQTVLRRCQADRAILALHQHDEDERGRLSCGGCDFGNYTREWCPTLRALASAYDVEPGRQEVGG